MAKETGKRRRGGGRAGNTQRRGSRAIDQMPWRLPINLDKPTEPLSEDGINAIHEGAMCILEDIGIAILNDEARDIFKAAGCSVDGDIVRMGRDFIMEMLSKAPETWTLTPRNPDRQITVGGKYILFGNVSSPRRLFPDSSAIVPCSCLPYSPKAEYRRKSCRNATVLVASFG